MFEYDGFIVNLSYSKASDTRVICEICGENGIITIDRPSQPKLIQYYDRKTNEIEDLSVDYINSFYYEITEMIDCIEEGRIESKSHDFNSIIELHQVMTEARELMGVHYPVD